MCDEDDCLSRFCYALSFCCCFLGTSFLIAILCISFISSAKIESGSIYIGDVLGDSSALLEVNSPAVAAAKFEIHEGDEIFKTNQFPTIVTDKLPLQHFIVSSEWLVDNVVTRDSLNYLGSYDPIYLLSGSSIQYNVTIKCTKRINSQYAACLYLFDDYVSFDGFINSNLNGHPETASHCFESKATATLSYSFNITTNGLYYVGIAFLGSVNIQASASVVRKRHDTAGLEQVCNLYTDTCTVTMCIDTFTCTNKATTYFLIKPTNTTYVNYTFSSPKLHGSTYAGFIATTFWCSLCCCCYCWFFCCTAFFSICDVDICDCIDFIFERVEKLMKRRQRFEQIARNDPDNNINGDNSQPGEALQHESVIGAGQIHQDYDNNDECITHETRGNVDLFEEDFHSLCLSSTLSTSSIQKERNTNPSLPSLAPIEEENSHNEVDEHLPTESDDIPLIIDFSRNVSCSVELTEVDNPHNIFIEDEISVQPSVAGLSASDTINPNENLMNTVSAAIHHMPLLDASATISHINQVESIQPNTTLDDVLLPLPSPLEEYKTLSLHSQEIESVQSVNQCLNEDILPHDNSTDNEERKELSSDNDASPHTESSSFGSLTIYKPLPSDFRAKLDESHAPAILSAIKGLVKHWNIVGIYLGIDDATIERIKSNNSTVDHYRKEMIFAWLRCGNATRQQLIETLKEVERNDIAHKLKEL